MNVLTRELPAQIDVGADGRSAATSVRLVAGVLASTAAYYVATQIAWVLCFPDSKVSLFFPPHAILLYVLLLVPTRQWWIYVLAASAPISWRPSRRTGRRCTP